MGVLTQQEKQLEKYHEFQSQIIHEEKISKIYQIFVGHSINKSIFRVKGKGLVAFSEAIGDLSPKYVAVGKKEDGKLDFSMIKAHPCFPNCFAIPAAFDVTGWKFPPKEGEVEGKLLIPNPSKILHTGQTFDYTNAEIPIKEKQKLYTTGYCEEIYVKNNKLWLNIHLETRTKNGLLVIQSKVQFVVREGGFAQ